MTVSADETGFVLEQDIRLSQSFLWKLLRRFYDEAGISAWSDGTVPWRITNSAFIAAAYARVARAYVADLAARGPGAGYDPARPVHIVEMGGGTGRFAFLFLRSLLSAPGFADCEAPRVRYVLTDAAESNLEFWMGHPKFAPFIAAGMLDFATFDAGADRCIRLRVSGETLSEETAGNPLVSIANYVFDSLPQDVYRALGGTLHECRITVLSPRRETDPSDVSIVERVGFRYARAPAGEAPYAEAEWNAMLATAAGRQDDVPVLFPVAALAGIRTLARIGGGKMLLLASDIEAGFGRESSDRGDPVPRRYGSSFCLPVDFGLLADYAAACGGFSLHAPARSVNMRTAAFVFGGPMNEFRETRAAFGREVVDFGPADFYVLDEALRAGERTPELGEALAFLRLGAFDPKTFHHLSERIIDGVEKAALPLRAMAAQALERVAENDFAVANGPDVPFALGRAFWRMGRYAEAIRHYRESLAAYGDHHVTHFNIGLCHHMEGRFDDAILCFDRCLELDAGYEPAKEWKARSAAKKLIA